MDRRDKEQGVSQDGFWFRGKRSLISGMLRKHLNGTGKPAIVNIGAGTGDDLDVIAPFGNVYASDVDEESVAMIPDNFCYEKRVADACALPYDDAFFDAAVAFDVLEHIENDKKAVSELFRVLKPGGVFIFSVPAGSDIFSGHDRALGHFRRYDKEDVVTLFSGWKKEVLNYWNSLLYPLAAAKRKSKKSMEDKIQDQTVSAPIGHMLSVILKMEARLLVAGVQLPKGLSIVGVMRKPMALSKDK